MDAERPPEMPVPRLAHALVSASAHPEALLLVLHGILGRGQNWRSIAKRLVEAHPRWGALLVDLRAHGDSRGMPPPDDLGAAARDLVPFLEGQFLGGETPVRAVLGHSFGGKVALELVRQRSLMTEAPLGLDHLFVVDSLPGARPDRRGSEDTDRVLAMLEALPARFERREDFVAHVRGAGFGEPLARWLAQNLDRVGEAFAFGLALPRVRALLDDYFACDLWNVLEPPPGDLVAHLIVAGRSTVWSPEDRARAESLAAGGGRVRYHPLEDAGHWVHVDAPDALHTILTEALA